MPVHAVVFDCFGVLTSDGWLPFCQKYYGNDNEKMDQVRTINKRVDSGLYDYNDMVREAALLAGIDEPAARRQIESNVADRQLFAYIRDVIKPHYKVGMLSNAGDNWLDELFEPWQVSLFDAVALSYEMGVTKPAPSAYETIATRLNCLPEECVFIDDQERYVTGARDVGMRGIVFENTDQFIHDFKEMTT